MYNKIVMFNTLRKRNFFVLIIFIIVIALVWFLVNRNDNSKKQVKLYWFIPDGLRNDQIMDMYKWANEGKLPNLKKMMMAGSYGYSIPDFPSHTPTNFATLFTGTHPIIHGISDGQMHLEGYPLNVVAAGGFRSTSKWVSPAWTIFEANNLKTFLLSDPGSSPPEMTKGTTVRGRWGGWGGDFHAIVFQDKTDGDTERLLNKYNKLFYNGPKLTEIISSFDQRDEIEGLESFSPVKEIEMNGWNKTVNGYIYDSSDDQNVNYDKIGISIDNKKIDTSLGDGEWSEWLPITLKWTVKENTVDVPTQVKVKVIRLTDTGKFRIRLLYNVLNSTLTLPDNVANEMNQDLGPMVDFPDNYPPQLVYYPEDKQTFLEEANMSLDWHKQAVSYMIKKYSPEIIIHDIYTPNQMLTSKWWMGYVDPASKRYNEVNDEERQILWSEVKDMYQKIDNMLGEIINNTDKNTLIVFSSDHGAAALNKRVRLNNIFAQKGWLTVKYDSEKSMYDIDWEKTKVAFLENTNIYINPNGLGGKWTRATGLEYEKLRNEVITELEKIEDTDGSKTIDKIVKWEDGKTELGLPSKQAGDLIIVNKIGYQCIEKITENIQDILETPVESGYKQGILANNESALWTGFAIMGPGVKKGYKIKNPISNADQLPTILKLLKIKIPDYMQGKVVEEIIQ